MSLALLFPLGLLALAAWALPLLLHLARREQRTPTPFAALRWLSIRQKPRQRLRFEEWPLLLVRLLLVAAIVVLLARPVQVGGAGDTPWLLVHPALPAPTPGADETREIRWLAPGFPAIDAPRPAVAIATSSLLRQLDAELPAATAVTVQVPSLLDGADGERPRLSRTLDWQVLDAPAPDVGETAAIAAANPRLAIRHDDAHADASRWLRAVAVAWTVPTDAAVDAAATPDVATLDASLPDQDRVLAWLAGGELPAPVRQWIDRGGTALLAKEATWPGPGDGVPVWRDHDGRVLAVAAASGRGRVVQLREALQPDALPALLEPDFPHRLRALLQRPAAAPTRVDAAAHAPLTGGAGHPPTPRPLETPFAWLVLALFALERLLATGHRRGAAS